MALLPPGKTLADCSKGQCEVEVGRTIGADYIVTGEVLKFGDELRLNLKVHHCVSGAFLGSQTAKGSRVRDLESGLTTASGALFAMVRTHAGVGLVSGGGAGGGEEGRIGGGGGKTWDPTPSKKAMVQFTSEPSGATVLVDGTVMCPSTPCSKLVPAGVVQVQMQRERYAPRTEAVTVGATGTKLEWKLSPTCALLTVRSTPDSLPVTINGEVVGRTPVLRRELDPGAYEVRIADDRYQETGERVVLATGADRTVELAPAPREGAIDVTATDVKGNDVVGKLTVDGKPAGEVPGTVKLMVGRHKLSVSAGSSGTWRGEVTVAERQVTPVVAKLVKGAVTGDGDYELAADGEAVVRGDLMW
ncbi:MAG: PEGA domain-containing protein, partial [bacterium]